ncbi:MAG: efflux RND transporter periplasmic adaptor subunit [Acinetobacter populi]|uniref:efflux RND transporter periplasmic adaptor subunit n=1 Tax=Acinetobacter populi TaxID=1582270 RepID=UPI00235464C6|nr:efflux RND transporter periplasmic adaptor subunit [Acinetobacter populi]MCH4246359.1 efflux RND transporter periplasmic adaptor subunit [Acinetobacter populi]
MRPKIKINSLLMFIGLHLFCMGLLGCDKSSQQQQSEKTLNTTPIDIIAADLVAVKQGYLQQKTTFTGSIQAVNHTSIQSQVSATVLQVSADVGQMVNKGQLLVQLNNQDNAARLAQAKANLAAAEAQATLDRSLMDRKKRLFDQGFIAKLEWEQSQVEYKAQLENVKAQQANVDIAVKAAQDAVIRSPISGYVTSRQVNVGQTIAMGQTLFDIVDPSQLEIKANLAASDQGKIAVGQKINFRIQGNPTLFPAQISRISPVADTVSRNIEFFARPQTSLKQLSIGAFVEGEIIQQGNIEGQLIPLASVQDVQKNPFVWVVRDNKIQRVNIDVLQLDQQQELALVKGLHADDQISLVKFTPQQQDRSVHIEK